MHWRPTCRGLEDHVRNPFEKPLEEACYSFFLRTFVRQHQPIRQAIKEAVP